MSFIDNDMTGFIRRQMKSGGTTYYDAELVNAFWLTDEEVYRSHIPYPLKPLPDPIVIAFAGRYPKVAGLFPYDEYGLALLCSYRGAVGKYWLSMGLSDDIATFFGREIYGIPKKMADIEYSSEDGHVECRGSRRGQEIFRMVFDRTAKLEEGGELLAKYGLIDGDLPLYNIKELLSTSVTRLDYLPRLTSCSFTMKAKDAGPAQVQIDLHEHPHDAWYKLPVKQILGATYARGDAVLSAGKKLKRIGFTRLLGYLPHLRKKYDRGDESGI